MESQLLISDEHFKLCKDFGKDITRINKVNEIYSRADLFATSEAK